MTPIKVTPALSFWSPLLERGFQDDGLPWDWTTLGTLSQPDTRIEAQVLAKSAGVWAAKGLTEELAAHGIQATSPLSDGTSFKKGTVLSVWKGPARSILAIERPFLNLAAYACGIAANTHELVRVVRKALPKRTPRVVLTRKTLPGYRDLAIHSVIAGGGHPHRVSLSGGVLIKENHIAAAGGILEAVTRVRKVAPHGLKIECEVRNQKELAQALEAQADAVLLDNFKPQDVKSALKFIEKSQSRPQVEVSGGINEANIAKYAIAGVDVISVGAITHSVRVADLSLLVKGT